MYTDTSLITFKAISNFTNDLAEVFEDKHRPLKLYAHLINKTTISHDKPIQKHIESFRLFCSTNRDAIATKNIKKLENNKISYSKRVFINMKEIFKHADAETQSVIWKHLLTISALVDPTGKARQVLKEQEGEEADFLSNIISKVESKVDPNANPMEAISSIMQSGIFTDLVQGMGSGLQDGSLDLGKLMGTVQKMVTKLSDEAGDQEGGEQAVNMINTMMGSLNAGAKAPDNDGTHQPMPDLSGMLGPMMSAMMGGAGGDNGNSMPDLAGMMSAMMGGAGGAGRDNGNSMPDLAGMMSAMMGDAGGNKTNTPSNSIEEHINAQVKAARAAGNFPTKAKVDEVDEV